MGGSQLPLARMTRFATTELDSDPALQRVIAESRAQLSSSPMDRERTIEHVAAVAFLVVATAMALLIVPARSVEPGVAVALVLLYALATRVEFQTGSGWTDPSQVVFVPMLFLLPTAMVPLLVATALVVARIPEYWRGTVHWDRAALRIGDAWYSVWPALVLTAAGATSPDWGDWPIYVAAFAAQVGIDTATTAVRVIVGLRVPPRTLFDELRAIYLVDALLSPIGLLAAFASVQEQWAFLLVLPVIGLVRIFARERAARIDNAMTLSSAYRGTAHLLGELLSASHEYTGEHSRSVVLLAHQVGERIGLDDRTLREIEFGALLHDVGKMSVPSEIINKPSALTDAEWDVMKRHTLEGEEMLDRIGGVLGEVGEVVRSHHERYDGKGYPDGLRGEEIPIASRVITACDSFNAMTTDRPYRVAMTVPEAIGELHDNAGTQFDPAVVDALIEVVAEWPSRHEPSAAARVNGSQAPEPETVSSGGASL